MSRQLPARPNLEQLKKQSKELLEHLRHGDASVQLADAQHGLAREYGFASWPKLKAHCELQASEQATAQSPFAGRWLANLARSRFHPASEWRGATVVFDVGGDGVRITDVVVDASGREERHVNAIVADGLEHPSDSAKGYSLVARWSGSHRLVTVARKDGKVVGAATYEVSADGQTLTIAADQQVIVLDQDRVRERT